MGGGPPSPSDEPEACSMQSDGSLVEVGPSTTDTAEALAGSSSSSTDNSCRLLWSRSAVYVHPSNKSRDNIPGFLAILKLDACYLLAWIPTSSLSSSKDAFVLVERGDQQDSLVDSGLLSSTGSSDSFSFAVPVGQIYSLQSQAPTLTAWHGSVTVSLFGGTTLSTLFFHDDESPSTSFAKESLTVKPAVTWGGDALIQKLRSYATIARSVIEPSLFLVNPSRTDLEVHSTPIIDDLDDDPVPAHQRPKSSKKERKSILHQSLSSSKNGRGKTPQQQQQHHSMDPMAFGVLNAFSRVTKSARNAAQTILSHDLARPIVPHLPPPVQTLVEAQDPAFSPWQSEAGLREYNGAAVFLAKWARVVAEEGERIRREQVGASADGEEASALGAFEVLAKRYDIQRPRTSRAVGQPIILSEWRAWFDATGHLMLSAAEARRRIFQRGLDDEARTEAWLFLLNVVPWESNQEERDALLQAKREEYESLKAKWCNSEDVLKSEAFVEERHRIEIDCRRTDRSHPIFSAPADELEAEAEAALERNAAEDTDQRADYSGGQPPSNKHVRSLQEVLLTYNVYERELGYVQGMSDLCSPLYITMQADPALTFACFVAMMDRMKPNFLRDQSGMKTQLSSLQKLIAVMDPVFYNYLEKVDSMNLFFCYRWILVGFKREFPLGETLKIWENFFTDCCGSQFHLFFALAILQAHRDVTMRYLQSFDELLKYINELSFTMEAEPLLCQAEILYLSLRDLVTSEDRRESYVNALKTGDASDKNGQAKFGEAEQAKPSVVDQSIRDLLN